MASINRTGSVGHPESWLVNYRRSSAVSPASAESSSEARAKKMLADTAERTRIARLAAQCGDDFSERLQSELNRIGLSLFGLRLTLGICCPARLGKTEILRIIKFLALGLPIQGREYVPELLLAAVLRSLGP